jgi:hypothetical protein
MWPWLIGAGVLGLAALASGGSAAPATSMPLPIAPTGGGSTSNVTAANIRAAVSYALAHETNPANLLSFAQALLAYGGYAAQAAQLIAKATAIDAGSGSSAPGTAPTTPTTAPGTAPVFGSFDPTKLGATAPGGEATAWAQSADVTAPTGPIDLSSEAQAAANALAATDPLTGSVTSSTFALAVPAHPTNIDLQWWVNHYAGTSYTTNDAPTVADVMRAVKGALAHETSVSMLCQFAYVLGLAYWVQADYLVQRAATVGAKGASEKIPGGAVTTMLDTWTKKYGAGTPSSASVRKAFAKALMTETNPSSLLAFAAALDAIPWTDGGGALDARSAMVELWTAAGVHPAIPSDLLKYPVT